MKNDFVTTFLRKCNLQGENNISAMVCNGKSSVMFYVIRGNSPLYFIKLIKDTEDNALIKAEHDNLSRLNKISASNRQLQESIPTPVLFGYYEEKAFVVTDLFQGRKDLLFNFNRKRCEQAIDWLVELHQETQKEVVFNENVLIQYINRFSNSAVVSSTLPEDFRLIFGGVMDRFGKLNMKTIPMSFTHNDFSSANVLFGKRGIFVVDWVSASEDGFLFLDAFDLILYIINKRLNNYLESLKLLFYGGSSEKDVLRAIIKKYINKFNLSEAIIRWLIQIFFLAKALKFHRTGYSERVRQLLECSHFIQNIEPGKAFVM